ncbi:hypothetical protein KC332_g14704 [Hortaea werneckii]|nr:hypothetical protein KC350_g14107 [Hortaea werneckii]KAI6821166.1 hypothetical protein KC358_g9179 [Hortaea werneckii]KAI6899879.1 hypothetical protein KC348_g17013 [Hortaea werneckii]KAI6925937.1 hypothetical protein KC341_g13088 [Hortaea werneckii]KAI6957106.1 hypothetical protein KC321_g14781 [Hortaea werneckii]
MRAIRTGKPFSYVRFKDRPSSSSPTNPEAFCSMAALQKHRIAYVRDRDYGPREVVVRNLITGQVITAMSDSRERVQCLTLSTTHVAFVTAAGRLHTIRFDDDTQSMSSSRLPSSLISEMAGDGDFSLLLLPSEPSPHIRSVLALYNTKTHTLVGSAFAHQTAGSPPRYLQPMILLIDARTRHVDIFSTESKGDVAAGGPSFVGHMRFNLSDIGRIGNLQPISTDLTLVPRAKPKSFHRKPFTHIRPTGEDDEFHLVRVVCDEDDDDDDDASNCNNFRPMVLFNRRQCRLRISNVEGRLAGENDALNRYIDPGTIAPKFDNQRPLRVPQFDARGAKWKDTYFSHAQCSDFATFADEPRLRDYEIRHTSFTCLDGTFNTMEEDPYRSILTMGNDSYLVAFDFMGYGERGGICVYSFEEDVPLAGGQSTGLWDVNTVFSDDADSDDEAMGSDNDDEIRKKKEKRSWLDMENLNRSILRRKKGLNVWD